MKKAISTNTIREHIENARTFYSTTYSNFKDAALLDRLRTEALAEGIVCEIAIANICGANYSLDDICNALRTLGFEIIDSNAERGIER